MIPGDCAKAFWDCLDGRLKRNRSSSGSGAPWLISATSVTPQADMGTSGYILYNFLITSIADTCDQFVVDIKEFKNSKHPKSSNKFSTMSNIEMPKMLCSGIESKLIQDKK